ncbi:MAG: 50S ribosomal protein L35 [Desulfovibrionaceae bacterium]|jgi:large subunit ribosomal protein L35
MPKMKTNRSAAKRFSKTGAGKWRRHQQGMRHILTKMQRKRQRRLNKLALVDQANAKALDRLMPYA